MKHPDCEERCQIAEHKGYQPCEGFCNYVNQNAKLKAFDPRCLDLALHFLDDEELGDEQRRLLANDMAYEVQVAVEDWFAQRTDIRTNTKEKR